MSVPAGFKVWWPEEGEDVADAVCIELSPGLLRSNHAHQYAAEAAGEYDHGQRDGWERTSDEQTVAILAVGQDDEPLGDPQLFIVTREIVPHWHATQKRGGA